MRPVNPNEALGTSVHRIDVALTIYTVAAEHARLLTQLSIPGPLRIDLSGIKECDCAGLQLLCALQVSARQSGRNLEWTAGSEALSRCAQAAGFAAEQFQPTTRTGQP